MATKHGKKVQLFTLISESDFTALEAYAKRERRSVSQTIAVLIGLLVEDINKKR